MNFKNKFILLFILSTFFSCEGRNGLSDADATLTFVILASLITTLVVGGIYANWEEERKSKEIIKRYNGPEEKEKRRKEKEEWVIKHELFVKKNPQLVKSRDNLEKSINLNNKQIPKCKKCSNNNYTLWELHEKSFTIRCDACKRKSLINNELSHKIYSDLNKYLKWEKYCQKNHISYSKFSFNYDGFRSDTPIHRALKLKGLLTDNKPQKLNNVINPKRSRRISQKIRDQVWKRDEGKCVECGSNKNLEFDHIIPHSKGGANTYRNIQLLCESCNRAKSDKIG